MPKLDDRDLQWIRETGRETEEVLRQLRLLRTGPRYVSLDRPCTAGDGITQLDPAGHGTLEASWAEAAAAGRIGCFVPASGAATRMFSGLARLRDGDPGDEDARRTVERAEDLAAWPVLEAALARRGGTVLDALLEPWGLDGPRLPKGLVPFHRYPDGPRTAFEEHLVEAEGLAADASGRTRLHLTVTPEHRAAFEALLAEIRGERELHVVFSHQAPATDAVCVDLDGFPFRDEAGRLLFRPAGHGSLLCNLAACDGDVILVKNIDNIVPQDRRESTIWPWRRRLAGLLVQVQARAHALAFEVEAGRSLEEAEAFLAGTFGTRAPEDLHERRADWLLDELTRPLRVAGMVPSTGEPGGGPFWLIDGRPQIVEGSQVDHRQPDQEATWRASTHFNPVDLALGVRDHRGRPLDLGRFRDPDAVILTQKSVDGRPAWVYENPGLWNGAMAGWNSIFVEIPLACFAPVKTMGDLLRPAHQPAPRSASALPREGRMEAGGVERDARGKGVGGKE